jgi:hypothetical protein
MSRGALDDSEIQSEMNKMVRQVTPGGCRYPGSPPHSARWAAR